MQERIIACCKQAFYYYIYMSINWSPITARMRELVLGGFIVNKNNKSEPRIDVTAQ